ncbi:hypothetical protein [Massilia sp. IC2-476]|uniref:hypothetical protein n=1 Tax=Massilia sp. IC2-476 TaxID=2887199 RepID=UPI001D12A82B|nr:hypothetical protein [Massilia sp. IC2-476]MCC2973346.1 hypothetical protein [Massilia sp. IC2-476]
MMIARMTLLVSLVLAAGATLAQKPQFAPREKLRVHSTFGFSLLPPPGQDWTEKFDDSAIDYTKKTDPRQVSFYTQALLANCTLPLPGKDGLLAFVRGKDEWGSDGRFKPVSSSFLPDPGQSTCVRYRMSVNDYGANNRSEHPFLVLHVVGRFCTHPQDAQAVVDIAYSVRHVPGYDARALEAEGEAFLDSLGFDPLPAGQRKTAAFVKPCAHY